MTIRSRILHEAKHDVNRALDIACERLLDAYRGCSSGMHYAPPLTEADLDLDDQEPLDHAAEQSPHG